jgi:hypothetical protein
MVPRAVCRRPSSEGVATDAVEQGVGVAEPAEAVGGAGEGVAGEAGEDEGGGEGEVVAAEGEGVEVGGVEVTLAGAELRERDLEVGEELAGLGLEVAVAEADGDGDEVLGDAATGGVAAGVELGAGGGEAAAGLGGGEGDGGVGGQGFGAGEGLEVGAQLGVGEGAGGRDGVFDDVAVGGGEDVEEGDELVAALLQAEHAAVHEGGGLVAADVGGEAGVGVDGEPAGAVVGEAVGEAVDGVAGVGEAGGGEGGLQAGARGLAPGVGEGLGGAGAHVGAGGRVGAEAGAEEGDAEEGGDDASATATQLAVELGEEDRERGPAALGFGREAAQDQAQQALGEPRGALRRIDDAAELGDLEGVDVLAGEGSVAEQALVEGDAEAELIAALVDLLAAALLGGHVRGRADEGAVLGERLREGGGSRSRAGSLRALARQRGDPVSPAARARPKSKTCTLPSRRTRTLLGLKSRWMTPTACAATRPRPAATKAATISRHGPRALLEPAREGDALDVLHHHEHALAAGSRLAAGLAVEGVGVVGADVVDTATTLGWESLARAWASRWRRAWASASGSRSSPPGRSSLIATLRSRLGS